MLLIIVGGLLCISGLIDINLPRWADIKNEVTIFSGIVVVLWVLSGVLTAVDHFRFGGWIDDGPTGADQFASSYCHAVIEGNDDIAAEMVAPYLAKNFTDFSERLQAIRRELGNLRAYCFRCRRPRRFPDQGYSTIDCGTFREIRGN